MSVNTNTSPVAIAAARFLPGRVAQPHIKERAHVQVIPRRATQRKVEGQKLARRDFQVDWGNTPISRQAKRALLYDTREWLAYASGVNFDNRFLMTVQPNRDDEHGTWHAGLVALDYSRVSGMGNKRPPAWEGVWTGLRILNVLVLEVDKIPRCFILALSDGNQIHLWELKTAGNFDHDGSDDVSIESIIETRGFTFRTPGAWKRLMGAIWWVDKIRGEVSAQAFYRTDESECWNLWDQWSDCVEYRACAPN